MIRTITEAIAITRPSTWTMSSLVMGLVYSFFGVAVNPRPLAV